jgi:CspA family cold shock protein
MTGTIKKITDKGFGFIASPELPKDIFFHSNSLVDVTFDELREGDMVTFETENSPKGMNAVNVQRAVATDDAQAAA